MLVLLKNLCLSTTSTPSGSSSTSAGLITQCVIVPSTTPKKSVTALCASFLGHRPTSLAVDRAKRPIPEKRQLVLWAPAPGKATPRPRYYRHLVPPLWLGLEGDRQRPRQPLATMDGEAIRQAPCAT